MKSNKRYNEKDFLFLSDAKSFQRRVQREGYKTEIINHIGTANPYRTVRFWID